MDTTLTRWVYPAPVGGRVGVSAKGGEAVGGILEQIQAQLNRIEARLAKCTEPPGGMVGQRRSPLGARKHMAAVKRRVAEAIERGILPIELGAAIDGEKYYLTQASLAEELGERTRASLGRVKGVSRVANDTAASAVTDEEDAAYRAALERGRRARGDV
jgi:hypothetical protein